MAAAVEGPIAKYRTLCLRFYMSGDADARGAINYFENCPKPAAVTGGANTGGGGGAVAIDVAARVIGATFRVAANAAQAALGRS